MSKLEKVLILVFILTLLFAPHPALKCSPGETFYGISLDCPVAEVRP